MRKYGFFVLLFLIGCVYASAQKQNLSNGKRIFIAHRGVNMSYTIAGENSLEAIRLTKAAGFGAIETDVRLTSDSCLVIMHDSTLNRTCLNADGSPLLQKVTVASKTLKELKSDYILKATSPDRRSAIPTLREYLLECKRCGLYTFIEPKLYDVTGKYYKNIIAVADEVFGHGHYVITSNNKANDIIRNMGIKDVRLMGILNETTYEKIHKWGNAILAVSVSKFNDDEYASTIKRAKEDGMMCESHADKFAPFDKINRSKLDFVSTDFLAPDYRGQGKSLLNCRKMTDFVVPVAKSINAVLNKDDVVSLKEPFTQKVEFGGIYLEMDVVGEVTVELGNQKFTVRTNALKQVKHQVLINDKVPAFNIKVISAGVSIKNLNLRIIKY